MIASSGMKLAASGLENVAVVLLVNVDSLVHAGPASIHGDCPPLPVTTTVTMPAQLSHTLTSEKKRKGDIKPPSFNIPN